MAKKIQVSSDGGTSWGTLPGSSGDFKDAGGSIDDTIFGQSFASSEVGLLSPQVTANGLYKGFAGYVATIKKSGTSTSMVAESMSLLSGKTYQIDTASRNLWDHSATFTFKDTGTAVNSADIANVNYLLGQVTFANTYTPAGAITVDGNYFPLASVGKANSFTLNQSANMKDETDFDIAQTNGGYKFFTAGLKTVNLTASGIYAAANGFQALLEGRSEFIIELNPDGTGKSIARGFFKLSDRSQSGNVGDVEAEDITFNLNVPDVADLLTPFTWQHLATTTLNIAIRDSLTSWQDGTAIKLRYLPDGVSGFEVDALVASMNLTGGLEVMNDFAATFQAIGQPIAV